MPDDTYGRPTPIAVLRATEQKNAPGKLSSAYDTMGKKSFAEYLGMSPSNKGYGLRSNKAYTLRAALLVCIVSVLIPRVSGQVDPSRVVIPVSTENISVATPVTDAHGVFFSFHAKPGVTYLLETGPAAPDDQMWAPSDDDAAVAAFGVAIGIPALSCAAYASWYGASAATGCDAAFIQSNPNCVSLKSQRHCNSMMRLKHHHVDSHCW